ncbi:uncharacterized protein LOC144349037, partial [Saccoglossus kowalevskii]
MASSLMGTVSQFNPQEQTWEDYCEVMDQFFHANSIDDNDRKRAVLLSSVGPKTYALIKNLCQPDGPTKSSYADLVKLVKAHYTPKPSEIVERYKFNSRVRKPGESVQSYMAELRRLSEHCNFGTTLETMLRDRLVCGINDQTTQRKLLMETTLSLENALIK